MKCQIARISKLALILALGAGIAPAQNSTNSAPLGDLARQLKAQRAKSQEKSKKVFTNDDLATLPPSPGRSEASPAKPSATIKEATPGEKSAKATLAETGEETHGEKYYRDRKRELQGRLEIDQRELSVLEQKLGQNQMMYYPDPNKGLLQESGPTAMSDINKLQDQIAKKKAEISADQEAMENLQEQLRRDGGDAGWLRNDSLPASNPNERRAMAQTSEAPQGSQAANQSEKPEDKRRTKEYWQARFKSARAHLADAKEHQQLAEDELNLLQIQDARALDPNVKTELAAKIKAKEGEVSEGQAATEEAKKALENLQKEFQASGAPDEWSETETETGRW
jgi:hypothetical protein